ncbi:MAG: YggT family protein [Methylococcales bacterium]|nr:YggT family protein [Methylococcales bacterium]
MDNSYITNPLIFIIDTLFSLYILAVMLRFLFQWMHVDFYNPISQFLVKVTHPPLKLLRRVIPAIGKIDTSSIVLALGLQISLSLILFSLLGKDIALASLLVFSVKELINLTLNIFVFAVFARAMLSWFSPSHYNPATSILNTLTEPLLNMCRKIIPDMGGIDFSPLIVLLALQLAKMMILPPLVYLSSIVG